MGVKTKSKRKIEINGRRFLWYVAPDEDYPLDIILHVYSGDKRFYVTYALGQTEPKAINMYIAGGGLHVETKAGKPENERVLRVLGPEFNGKPVDIHSRWRLVVCPQWEHGSIVAPADVRRLTEWCLSDKPNVVLMDWEGNRLTI